MSAHAQEWAGAAGSADCSERSAARHPSSEAALQCHPQPRSGEAGTGTYATLISLGRYRTLPIGWIAWKKIFEPLSHNSTSFQIFSLNPNYSQNDIKFLLFNWYFFPSQTIVIFLPVRLILFSTFLYPFRKVSRVFAETKIFAFANNFRGIYNFRTRVLTKIRRLS